MPTKYYKVHGGRLTFGEYRRMAPDPFTFLICAVMKLFGGMSFDFSVPRIDELHYLDEADLPRAGAKKMKGPIKKLTEAGFALRFHHEAPLLESHRLGVAAVLVSQDRKTVALVMYGKEKDVEKVQVSCFSRFADGNFGATTTQKKEMTPNPANKVAYHPGVPADELVELHREHLAEWDEEDGLRPRKLDDAGVAAAVLEGEQQYIDFHAERGVLVPMSKAEVRRIREANEDD
jgi:hypothetical protein